MFAEYVRQLHPSLGEEQGRGFELGFNQLCRTKLSNIIKQMRKV